MKFDKHALSAAEAALLSWQFGASEEDRPFHAALWVALAQAWELSNRGDAVATDFLARLGSSAAFPDEVAVYQRFKGPEGEAFWLDILERAELDDRRQREESPPVERRRTRGSGTTT